jgi:signal transduction histidine kinase/ActR/RegA family two-component response regulator
MMLLLRLLLEAGLGSWCILSGDLLYLPIVLCALVIEVVLMLQSLHSAASRLQAALIREKGSRQSLPALIETVICRLNTLQWEVQSGAAAGSLPEAESDSQQAEAASGLAPACERVFDAALKQFRCSKAAIILWNKNEAGQSEALFFARPGGGGRFKTALLRLLSSLQSAGTTGRGYGFFDSAAAQDSAQDLAFFGLRYSLIYPLRRIRPGETEVPCLWLGYSAEARPLKTEIDRAEGFALQAGREIKSEQRYEKLSGRVAEAESGNERKSEFLAQMSHDLRTPLNNIKSILTLIKLDGVNQDTPQMLDMALNNCENMRGLVEDILDYSRHRAGKLTAARRIFDLAQCVEEVHSSFAVMARLKGLDFRVKFSSGQVLVDADPGHIKRVVTNLISNAIKYTQRGFVEVEARAVRGSAVQLLVRDSGSGMTAEQVHRLFTPFTTFGSPEQQGQPAGIGLGLALSRILTELNSGKIEVNSIAGSGSEFRVELPAALEDSVPDELVQNLRHFPLRPERKTERAIARTQAASVLVVDDEPDCVETLGRNLRLAGYRVLPCVSVREAIGVLNFEHPDYVISDANMPDGGVARILDFIRREQPGTPVAVLSGMDSSSARREYSALGAAGIFCKPVEMDELLVWLKEVPLKKAAGS